MSNYVLGGDPGKTGSFALVPIKGGSIKFIDVPLLSDKKTVDLREMLRLLEEVAPSIQYAGLEDVHAIFGSAAGSTFQFGWIAGAMECALYSMKIPFLKVAPKAWQAVAWLGVNKVQVPTGKTSKNGKALYKTDTKATSLLAAKRIFPAETFIPSPRHKKPHDGRVDAALIAHYVMTVRPQQ